MRVGVAALMLARIDARMMGRRVIMTLIRNVVDLVRPFIDGVSSVVMRLSQLVTRSDRTLMVRAAMHHRRAGEAL